MCENYWHGKKLCRALNQMWLCLKWWIVSEHITFKIMISAGQPLVLHLQRWKCLMFLLFLPDFMAVGKQHYGALPPPMGNAHASLHTQSVALAPPTLSGWPITAGWWKHVTNCSPSCEFSRECRHGHAVCNTANIGAFISGPQAPSPLCYLIRW